MLRVLFNSDAFKNARFAKIKSPVEAVVGTTRLVEDFKAPKPGVPALVAEMRYMGQDLANPLTVEGWHTGQEWIDSGTLVERINFTADQLGISSCQAFALSSSGLSAEVRRSPLSAWWIAVPELLGHYELAEDTHKMLVEHAQRGGELRTGTEDFAQRVGQMLQLIASTQEYLFA